MRSASNPAPPTPSSRRRWWFRIVALTIVPMALLGGLELVLRLAGYGYSPNFFLKTRMNGRTVYVENQKFGFRFFPPALARSPSPMIMEARKTTNTYRIFLLGESAALGDPDPAYGCGRYLEVLLTERYPGTRFEVVCAAMTAINSHALLPVARECLRHQADLWVIYAGNNEMLGPFGAGTVFGRRAPGLTFIRASLAAKTTRIGQLLDGLIQRSAPDASVHGAWRGMGMFLGQQTRHDAPGRERVYKYFRKNLDQILRAGRQAGVRVILCTVASNLKDCPPFASLHSAHLGASQSKVWDELFQDGRALESAGRFAEAAGHYEQAAQLDPHYAELQFRLAACYLALTNLAEARRCFERARDFDALPFRADSRINGLIDQLAREHAAQGVERLDAVGVLSSGDSLGIPGQESFHEHVHLNFEGNYLLARALAEQVARLLPPRFAKEGPAGEWASPELCARRLALTDWNRYRVWESVLQRVTDAPFTNQSNALLRQKACREQLLRLKSGLTPATLPQARQIYQEALARAPDDFFLRRKWAETLEMAGDLSAALAEWQRVRELLPHHPIPYFQLGQLLARQGKSSEAEEYLAGALRIRPDFVEALDELGQVLAKQGKYEQSIARYSQALGLRPDHAAIHFRLADALAAHGKRTEALASLREAIRLRPGYWEARYLLGVELAIDEKIEEASEQFVEVVRLRPDYAPGHLNLGVAFARQGKMNEALAEFQATLRLDPKNKAAQQHIETIRSLQNGQR